VRRAVLGAALLGLGACQSTPAPSARLEPAPPAEPSAEGEAEGEGADPAADGAEPAPGAPGVYGTAPDEGLDLTPLSAIVEDPTRFEGRIVRTEGQIARVCQRMGCWMELREGEDGPAVRVPMAGHAFFLPRDSAGRHATMQGRVALRELSPAARAHLESEGARATASALSIEATGVVID
jgi:hypothetical protein